MTSESIIQKIDDMLLRGDFDTRAGLSFMGELVKDAFRYINEQREAGESVSDVLASFEARIGNVEKGLKEWMDLRKEEAKKADEERKWWRRLILGTMFTLLLTNLIPELIKMFGG